MNKVNLMNFMITKVIKQYIQQVTNVQLEIVISRTF